MQRNHTFGPVLLGILSACITLSSCSSIGPKKVPLDRSHYNHSLTESWKEQILLNIVKIRYVEPLFFVDVGEIVAGYSLETGAELGFSRSMFDLPGTSDSSTFQLGMSGKFTDRPTITYRPMTGDVFLKGIMSPIPLQNILMGMDSGVSASFLMRFGVRNINGVRNEALRTDKNVPAESSFQRAVDIISRLQLLGTLHVTTRVVPPRKIPGLFLSLGDNGTSPDVAALVMELQTLLDLDPAISSYALAAGTTPPNDRCIALQTYSLMQILAIVAARVQIPEEDVVTQCATPGFEGRSGNSILDSIEIHASTKQPEKTFAAIRFHDHWFWVDDHDLTTKRVFSFILLAFTLLEKDTNVHPLQLTIPAQ